MRVQLGGLGLMLCVGACGPSPTVSGPTATTIPASTTSASAGVDPLTIYACDDPAMGLDGDAGGAMMEVGFTRCAMPFGVLIGADEDISKPYVKMVATLLAELLDLDRDGAPDDPEVLAKLQRWDTAWLSMPSDPDDWESDQLPTLERHLGYDIIVPTWWMGGASGQPDSHAKRVMVEEVTHFITQFGWSPVYPDQLGVEGWTSIIARETATAQCDWWQHPENDCPGSPADSPGDCSDPNCDVVEFYQQVVTLRAGMEPGWWGIGFPRTRDELEAKLSDTLKAMMDDPAFHQPSQPLQFSYP
jgi:hypothetical protein